VGSERDNCSFAPRMEVAQDGPREGLNKFSRFPRRLEPRSKQAVCGGTKVPPFQYVGLSSDFLALALSQSGHPPIENVLHRLFKFNARLPSEGADLGGVTKEA